MGSDAGCTKGTVVGPQSLRRDNPTEGRGVRTEADTTPPISPAPKPVVLRDPAYLLWVAERPCCACLVTGMKTWGCDPAHVRTRRNHGDELVVPLCRAHHRLQHAVGIKTFVLMFGLDLLRLAREYRESYLVREVPAF